MAARAARPTAARRCSAHRSAGSRAAGRRCPTARVAVDANEVPTAEEDECGPSNCPAEPDALSEGAVTVQDDLMSLLCVLPADVREPLLAHPKRTDLLEVVFDLGRQPEARFLGVAASEPLREQEVTRDELDKAEEALGEFGADNRAGITGTLHRISCMRNRRGVVVGLTCRIGRAVTGHVDMIRDLLDGDRSVLFLGRPGVGKTTVIREMARVLADECSKRVVVVDTSNEIGGDGDVPHPAIGSARRMQVPDPAVQHRVMVEAVENHMPQVVIVDEIGTEAESLACRTIAERGVQLIGTAHGQVLQNLLKNPTLTDLVGGVESVTLGDEAARTRGTQKSVLERKASPTFPVVIEMRERSLWIEHDVEHSVDALLQSRRPMVVERRRNDDHEVEITRRDYDDDKNSGPSTRDHHTNSLTDTEWGRRLDSVPDPNLQPSDLDALQSLALIGQLDPGMDVLTTRGGGRGRGRRKQR